MSNHVKTYNLASFEPIHRLEEGEVFGNNSFKNRDSIADFEVYSSVGQHTNFGPLKGDFFMIGLCLTGNAQLDINHVGYRFSANSIFFKSPDKLFAFADPSVGFYEYYLIFTENFIEKVVPNFSFLQQQFPFLSNGIPTFELNPDEAKEIKNIIERIEAEVGSTVANREWMIGSYLFQLFISANRSYVRQALAVADTNRSHLPIVERFGKLIEQHYKTHRSVKDYADMLNVTPNYLNKLIKQQSNKTASAMIQDRILLEMKTLLRYSEKNISEIAWELNFTDAAHFSHFFKQATGLSPKTFRQKD
jgi:AraC family transcriptional regulator, transcriptional activator of pobA